ncbi:HTH La-type RNA-binding domain-containing protein [Caenorhabditis elegans]|uniref:HTH La-type RNA-binding domain-containing protein n=1 Tax=Caenorhabditis elegans TaxID=6239 RepID=H2KZU0_CAEEL|nr:HTH La-type RNA-binding domain-containing protein [Caenorhabditis elegans]CCD69787.1 HTH La-type RNA-binding domain-containing protein [Caenorhabditis elegans]|eukprot:NP_871824.3 LARP (RNA binding La related protein) homolog [Caenorhabditis elegans]
MMIGPQPPGPSSGMSMPSSSSTNQFVPAVPPPPPLSREEIKQLLKNQLEYYFSRENLSSDRYLKCQMDSDNYVPINVLAGFPKIMRLTTDVDLIVEALKESTNVELDEKFEKVRAITKRKVMLIREIPETHREEVVKLIADGPPYTDLQYGVNDGWYVTYENELDAQVAYVAVQHRKNEITQKQVCARIKTCGPSTFAPPPEETPHSENGQMTTLGNGEQGTVHLRELGQTLSDYGFVPVATYRPGDPISSHFEYITPTFRFSGNSLSYNPPMPPVPPLPPQHHQQHQQQQQQQQPPLLQNTPQPYYYGSSVSTTPRNYDEMSTASSNSTHTTTSNYNNRNGSRNGGNQYYESRSSFSNSNEWRSRGGGNGGRFQNNYSENNGRQSNGSNGRWRGNNRNGATTNGYGYQQHNNRQNHYQNGQQRENGENGHHNHYQNGQSSNSWWSGNDGQTRQRKQQHNGYNNRPTVSSSSSSSTSSKYFSPDAVETPTNSGSSTPPQTSVRNPKYHVPTPTDLPPPPVWPAPNFDRRRKSSETSFTTNTTTNTLTPSTPVTPPVLRPAFSESKAPQEPSKPVETKENNKPALTDDFPLPEPLPQKPKIETNHHSAVEKDAEKIKVRSPPVVVASSPAPAAPSPFSFEETAFPSLPKKVEPVKPPQKPTFSSVAAGRLKKIKQLVPEKKTSYAEKAQQYQNNHKK